MGAFFWVIDKYIYVPQHVHETATINNTAA